MASHSPSSTGTTLGNSVPGVLQAPTTQLAAGQLPNAQQLPQIRDPEWLKLEVCREFQRSACKRTAEDCKYAHPPPNVQILPDGKVIACFDALKRRCSRETCKYLHPPDHLKQQLEINGRNNLIQQRAMLQMLPLQQTILQAPAAVHPSPIQVTGANTHPIMSNLPATQQLYNHTAMAANPTVSHAYTVYPSELGLNQQLFYYPTPLGAANHPVNLACTTPTLAAQPLPGRADRLEVCRDFQRNNCNRGEFECRYAHPENRNMIDQTDNTVTVCMDCIKGRCTRDKCKYFHPPTHLQAKIKASQQQPFGTAVPAQQQSIMHLTQGQTLKRQLEEMQINSNGQALGQPPIKRHAMETTKVGNPTSPPLTTALHPANGIQQHMYNTYFAMQQPAQQYYQVPMVHMYGGQIANTATPIPSPGLQTTPADNPSPTTLTLLNGQGQSQALSALTVCRDFQSGKCNRPRCRFVHVYGDYVEVKDDKVTVCIEALKGKCTQLKCKYYHYPTSEITNEPPQSVYTPNIVPSNLISPQSAGQSLLNSHNGQHIFPVLANPARTDV